VKAIEKEMDSSSIVVFFLLTLISFAVRFPKEEDKPKIIVVAPRLDIEYWKIFESGAKEEFNEFDIGSKVIAPDSESPISNHTNMLKKVLKQQPDALILAPIDYPSIAIHERKRIRLRFRRRGV
jgi:ribose transport system substrate-binding protein